MSIAAQAVDLQVASVLIATDFSAASEKPLRHALAIARCFHARFCIAHVVSSLGFSMAGPEATLAAKEAVCHDAECLERELASAGELAGLEHKVIIREGRVWEEIENIIREERVDVAVIGTHGRRGVGKFILGSVAEQIFRHAHCPVLTVGPGCYREPRVESTRDNRTFFYATDFGEASLQALPYAISFANHFAARLVLFHVVPPFLVPEDFNTYTAADVSRMREESRIKRMQHLEDLVRGTHLKVKPGFVVEDPSASPIHETILLAADRLKADLLVMGLRRSEHIGTASHLPWTTAYEIACGAMCPVLTVRSDAQSR
jgi:nucleotide-binding universal stress UspA family protein